jgi:hypothetical protein
MRKYFFAGGCLLLQLFATAQEPADALRLSWTEAAGTARQQAIGGAMTSLGGDLSAAFSNPAGLAFYKTGDLVISPVFSQLNNRANYLGRSEKANRAGLGLGLSGFVIGSKQENKEKGSVAFAVALNKSAWFGSNVLYRGLNNTSSYSQKFLEEIAGQGDANVVASNYPFGSSLAFNTYWIDTISGGTNGSFRFKTRAPVATGLIQENQVASSGALSELAIALAGSKNEKLLYGVTLGIPFLNYKRSSTFTEADATNVSNKFNYASIEENLETSGNGANFKMGIIYRPAPQWRVGFGFHTPTLLKLTDKYSAVVTTDTENYKGLMTQSSKTFTNGDPAQYSYLYFSPYKLLASFSYVLREVEDITRQRGFITADAEFINYRASAFKVDPAQTNAEETKTYYSKLNATINQVYQPAFNLRLGGELKFTTVMVRTGFAYLGNPYKNINGEKGNRLQFSGGMGYRNKGYFIDVTYVHTVGKDVHFPYRLSQQPFPAAQLQQRGSRLIVTFGIKF